jgi:serine phosphatase RsbU (regulator of sigma subunit)
MVLGVRKDSQYEDVEIDLYHGDRLVVFTDGISETCSATDEEFGIERLLNIIKTNRQRSASELQRIILSAVLEFGHQRLSDDATLMIIALD